MPSEISSFQTPSKNPNRSILIMVVAVLLIVFGAMFAFGFIPRLDNARSLKKMEDETSGAIPVVHTVISEAAPFTEQGSLPGSIGAIQYATIYARVDGYLTKRFVDIGDHVKTGQLLALIDTPTIDQELSQARADLVQAQAQVMAAKANVKEALAKAVAAHEQVERAKVNTDYAEITAKRWQNMAAKGAVSLQSRDERVRSYDAELTVIKSSQADEKAALAAVKTAQSQVDVARATVVAKAAAVKRLEVQQSFKNVVAPFDGIITDRKVDPGELITAGSASSNLELFQLAQIDLLRIYVNAPQTLAPYLKPGQRAQITLSEFPNREFIGEVTNIAGALDPQTRTRQTEIHLKNLDHLLLPGMYAQVLITARRDSSWVKVPGTTLVAHPDGMYVVIAQSGKAHYQKVEIGRDFGDEVEIQKGLKGAEEVIVSPSIDLRSSCSRPPAREQPCGPASRPGSSTA